MVWNYNYVVGKTRKVTASVLIKAAVSVLFFAIVDVVVCDDDGGGGGGDEDVAKITNDELY